MAPPADENINRITLKKTKDNVRDPRFNKSGYKKCLQCGCLQRAARQLICMKILGPGT